MKPLHLFQTIKNNNVKTIKRLLLIVPGPTIILVISQAVRHGRKSVIPLAAGVVGGDFTAMSLSLLGLGAIMVTSATLFSKLSSTGQLWRVITQIGAVSGR